MDSFIVIGARRPPRELREVYFIQGVRTRLIKIGVANDTRLRLLDLQSASPDRLEVIGITFCERGGALEKEIHHRFRRLRMHGEWFRSSPAVMRFIADAKASDEELIQWRGAVQAIYSPEPDEPAHERQRKPRAACRGSLRTKQTRARATA